MSVGQLIGFKEEFSGDFGERLVNHSINSKCKVGEGPNTSH